MKINSLRIFSLLILGLASAIPSASGAPIKAPDHARKIGVHVTRMSHPTATGSFLGALVYTVPDLIDQVEIRPAIAMRYARHYHTTPAKVIRFMKDNLVESYMPSTQTFRTYWVRRNGQIVSGNETLKKGTRVFALRNGTPILKWACGNPLTVSLPVIRTRMAALQQDVATRMSPSVQTLVPAEPADVVVPSEPAAPVAVAQAPEVDQLPYSQMASLPPSPSLPVSIASAPAHLAAFPIGAIGGVAAAVPVLAGITHGGSSSSSPAPTPEAGTALSFGLLGSFGAMLTRRRRAARRK
jgi:hypothetical protein